MTRVAKWGYFYTPVRGLAFKFFSMANSCRGVKNMQNRKGTPLGSQKWGPPRRAKKGPKWVSNQGWGLGWARFFVDFGGGTPLEGGSRHGRGARDPKWAKKGPKWVSDQGGGLGLARFFVDLGGVPPLRGVPKKTQKGGLLTQKSVISSFLLFGDPPLEGGPSGVTPPLGGFFDCPLGGSEPSQRAGGPRVWGKIGSENCKGGSILPKNPHTS